MTVPSVPVDADTMAAAPKLSPMQAEFFDRIVGPYLNGDSNADGWHLVDNGKPDEVRWALQALIMHVLSGDLASSVATRTREAVAAEIDKVRAEYEAMEPMYAGGLERAVTIVCCLPVPGTNGEEQQQ